MMITKDQAIQLAESNGFKPNAAVFHCRHLRFDAALVFQELFPNSAGYIAVGYISCYSEKDVLGGVLTLVVKPYNQSLVASFLMNANAKININNNLGLWSAIQYAAVPSTEGMFSFVGYLVKI